MPDEVSNGSRRSGARLERLGPEGLPPAVAGRVRALPGRRGRVRPVTGGRPARSPSSTVWPTADRDPLDHPVARSAQLVLHLHRLHREEPLAGRDGVARASTATDTTRPGMMARTSVGPWWAAAVAARRGPVPEVGPAGVLDLELEAPAVDDDLDRGPAAGRRRARCREDDRPIAGSGSVPARLGRVDVAEDRAGRAVRDAQAGHAGHRSIGVGAGGGRPGGLGRARLGGAAR